MTAADIVRDARRRHGLNQRSLGRRCGTSQTHISRIERSVVSPSVETLERLLEAMGERLELRAIPGPRGNQSTAELRAAYGETTPAERIVRAAELSYALTSIAAATRRS